MAISLKKSALREPEETEEDERRIWRHKGNEEGERSQEGIWDGWHLHMNKASEMESVCTGETAECVLHV